MSTHSCQFSVKKKTCFKAFLNIFFPSKHLCNIEERLFEKLGLNSCIFGRVGDGDGDGDDDDDDDGDGDDDDDDDGHGDDDGDDGVQ